MPFALPLLFLLDLLAAAITFAAVSSVPTWRRSAITAPVIIFIGAPMTLLAIMSMIYSSGWTNPRRSEDPVMYILLLLAAISIGAAFVAGLTCRFVFRTVAPRVEQWLGLRPFLLLQLAILCGGTLSLLVLLVVTPNLAYQIWVSGSRGDAVAAALVGAFGALGVLACILALLRLRNPEQYLPQPLPDFIIRHICSDKSG